MASCKLIFKAEFDEDAKRLIITLGTKKEDVLLIAQNRLKLYIDDTVLSHMEKEAEKEIKIPESIIQGIR